MTKHAAYGIFLLTVTVSLILGAAGLSAQATDDRERVQKAIAITDEVIEKARGIVLDSRSKRARILLTNAEEIQGKAKETLQSSAAVGLALNLTLEARKKANQAIGVARNETLLEENLKRIAEETIERIIRIREVIVENDLKAERPMRLIDEARHLLEQARSNAQELRHQLALNLAENARERTIRAEQQVRRLRALKETTERRLVVLERLIERARIRVEESMNVQTEHRLRMAEEQLEMARMFLNEGKYAAARITLEKSEKILRSLIRQVPAPSSSDVESLLDRAYRLLDRAEEMTTGEGAGSSARERKMIARAGELLEQAGEAVSNGRTQKAKRLIDQAQTLLRQAIREEREDVTRDKVAALIERVQALHDEVVSIMEDCDTQGTLTLFERAVDHAQKAKAYLDKDRLTDAEAEARIARNLYNRIREICSM